VNVHDRTGRTDDMVVERLHALAPHLDGEPDPAFRAATRARLVAMAAVRTPAPEPASRLKRLLAARATDAPPARWQTRLTAGLAGAALTVTAAAALVAVAAGAQPGDALYGLKRGTEQTQLALAGDARGRTLLDLAGTRLDELEVLVDEEATALPAAGAAPTDDGTTLLAAGADPELVLSTLATMDDQTTEGAAWMTDHAVAVRGPQPLEDLSAWVTEQSAGLTALQPLVPDEAEAAVGDSLVLLSDIARRSDGLRSAVACPTGPAVGGTDELGPVPGACAPEQPSPPATGGEGSGTGTGTTQQAPQASTPVTASVPPGGGTGSGGTGSGGGPGGGSGGGTTPTVPGLPTPGAGLPTLPVPLPTLPGTGPGSSTPPPVIDLDVCLGPIAIGDC
jgi:uncharacterized membrane protein YgcG